MDVETVAWLLTDDGQRLLAEASAAYDAHAGDVVRAGAAVRRVEPDPARAAAALTQAQLRERAVGRLGNEARRMYFTPDALEQTTRPRVAAHRAARLATARPGSVVDLGCGIGGDLVAFARAGITAAGVDVDPVRVALARANLEALDVPGAVQVADAASVDVSAFGAAYVDPARRSARGRVLDASGWTPPWELVVDLLGRHGLAKVAPGIPHDLLPAGIEAEWVSEGGDVTEASLWAPRFASAARRATVIPATTEGGGLASLTEEDDPYDGESRPVGPVGEYLYEPDGAVIRAGLVTAVAAGVGGHLVDQHIAYVTGPDAVQSPFARSYRVLEQLPYREKQLRAALRERAVGRLTIKKRGVQVVPEELRKRLALTGENEATVVLTRVAGAGTALLVEPL